MNFEPFRSVVLPKGKLGPELRWDAPSTGREIRTIILEGPALDPDAISGEAPTGPRESTVSRPASLLVPSTAEAPTAVEEDSGTYVIADSIPIPAPAPEAPVVPTAGPAILERVTPSSVTIPAPRPGRPKTRSSAAPRQFIVAYDGKLVGTYRSAKRIQNRTAYLNVAEQLIGQIEEFDPSLIRLYKLTELPLNEPISTEEIHVSYHNFPRDDVPAPPAPGRG